MHLSELKQTHLQITYLTFVLIINYTLGMEGAHLPEMARRSIEQVGHSVIKV